MGCIPINLLKRGFQKPLKAGKCKLNQGTNPRVRSNFKDAKDGDPFGLAELALAMKVQHELALKWWGQDRIEKEMVNAKCAFKLACGDRLLP